jgi:AGCS family alanine or glycine:cation symporter
MLFNIGLRLLNDYDAQRKAGIETPVFDSSQFPDLDLDLRAWPKPSHEQPAVAPDKTSATAVVDAP